MVPDAIELADDEQIGAGKSLLVRSSTPGPYVSRDVVLRPVVTEQQWQTYTDQRIGVEAELDVTEAVARRMVETLRGRCADLGMILFGVEHDHTVVGAIGQFRMPAPSRQWARLQDVDVFPAWRGKGLGTAMLGTMLQRLADGGSTMVVVGADEDDWPLAWYRRHGFRDVARVRKAPG